jgi:hypothetical protein
MAWLDRGQASMKRKDVAQTKRVLWRMTEAAPQGEFVDTTKPQPPAPAPAPVEKAEPSYGSWLESSFELLHGTEIHDGPDTVPDDLFDELFAPPATRSAAAEDAGSLDDAPSKKPAKKP